MLEYLDDPEATAQGLSPDGWLKSGDVGQFTESGCLKIVGRVKDMFIVGGFNWSRERMANYKVPRLVEFVDELPLNAIGKVVKAVLRERAATGGS